MKDRKGNELAVGDRVYVLDDTHFVGGRGRIIEFNADDDWCRVDDLQLDTGSYGWTAWCKPDEIEKQ